MEDKQENEIQLSDLTCIACPSEGMYFVVVKATTSVARNSRKWVKKWSRRRSHRATKYVPQNPHREISSEKCSVWNSASHIEQWFIEHSGALSMTLRLVVGQGVFVNALMHLVGMAHHQTWPMETCSNARRPNSSTPPPKTTNSQDSAKEKFHFRAAKRSDYQIELLQAQDKHPAREPQPHALSIVTAHASSLSINHSYPYHYCSQSLSQALKHSQATNQYT